MEGICKNCSIDFTYHPSQKKGIFCTNKCQGEYTVKKRFTKGTNFRQTMRKYLIENIEYRCEVCGINEWNGQKLTLQIDHIDGDRKNNELNNLRFICPNCHTQTKTWGASNISDDGRKRLITNKRNE